MNTKAYAMDANGAVREVAIPSEGWTVLAFNEGGSPEVRMIPTNAGIIPDRAPDMAVGPEETGSPEMAVGSDVAGVCPATLRRVGIFTDEMAQNIITRVVNFRLDAIQLNGHESPTLIRNLRATLTTPDPRGNAIAPKLQIWKAFSAPADDIASAPCCSDVVVSDLCRPYADSCDLFIVNV